MFSSLSILTIQSFMVSTSLFNLSSISVLLTFVSGLNRINIHFPLCIIYTSSYRISSSVLSYPRCPNSSVSIAKMVLPINLRWSIRRRWVQSQLPVYSGLSCINPSNFSLIILRTIISLVCVYITLLRSSSGKICLKQVAQYPS